MFLFSMYSKSQNFRNTDQVELILVPNDVEIQMPLVFINACRLVELTNIDLPLNHQLEQKFFK